MKLKVALVALAMSTALAGCTFDSMPLVTANYGAQRDLGYALPAIPIYKVPAQYRRQVVRYDTSEKPGTIVVDTSKKFLYFILPDGKAVRYGIGVGREGFEWKGTARVAMKR